MDLPFSVFLVCMNLVSKSFRMETVKSLDVFYVGGLHVNPKDGKIDDWIGATIAKYTQLSLALIHTEGTIPPSSPILLPGT